MMRWWRDPLVHCIAAGALLFAVASVVGQATDDRVIRVTEGDVARIASQWRAQNGRAPSAPELNGLVEAFVREEILVREALRIGLDRGDVIIRRRLAQKLRFVTEDTAALDPPDEAALRVFFSERADRYAEPERVSFSHVYWSRDRREDARADAIAAVETGVLREPDADAWRTHGDPFMLRRTYADAPLSDVARDFGESFAEAIGALPEARWAGPIASSFGWHAVRVDGRTSAFVPPFERVRDRVRADFDQRRRDVANDRRYRELRERYRVEIDAAAR